MTQQETMIARRDDFQALIDNTPFWHPTANGVLQDAPAEGDFVILPDADADTFARQFEQWSITTGCIHKYNAIDGWTIYHNNKYQTVPDDGEIANYIMKFVSNYCRIVTKKKNEDGTFGTFNAKTAQKHKTTAFTNNILRQLQGNVDGVHLSPGQKAPCCLLGELDPHKTTAMQNGILDRRKLPHVLKPLSQDYYTLNYLDYDYDPAAQCDLWIEFLLTVTNNDQDIMELLQQWAGYLLMNSNKYQKFMLCVGDGANGKGVFFDTITAAIGRNNVSNVPLASFAESAKLFSTYGKMVNMSNESSKHLEKNAESIIKEYVGGDKMTWERKYNDAFSAYPTARLMFACNELPTIHDSTDGMWRRMLYLPFDIQIPAHLQDVNLSEKLQQPTMLSGIFNWMLAGIESLETMGKFIQPKRCIDGLAQYKADSNPTKLFLMEHFEIADPDCYIVKADAYKCYSKWCDDNGFKSKGMTEFSKSMYSTFPQPRDRRVTEAGKRVSVFKCVTEQQGIVLGRGEAEDRLGSFL